MSESKVGDLVEVVEIDPACITRLRVGWVYEVTTLHRDLDAIEVFAGGMMYTTAPVEWFRAYEGAVPPLSN